MAAGKRGLPMKKGRPEPPLGRTQQALLNCHLNGHAVCRLAVIAGDRERVDRAAGGLAIYADS